MIGVIRKNISNVRRHVNKNTTRGSITKILICFRKIKFSKIEGIIKTEVGYCGGNSPTTTYKEVCNGNTNHAEVVKLDFDEKIISYEKILKIFFQIHDPTTLNSQGPDFGTQYRSEIFYLNTNQKEIAEKVLKLKNNDFSGKIVTKLSLLKNYCVAEEYHQKYLDKKF